MISLTDYITSDWRRQALVLGCVPFSDRHTSINIAEWMVKELDEWQLTPVTEMVVSDTASNQMGVFNEELVPHLPNHLQPAKCACHVLQLCIGDCILQKPSIALIIKNCRWFYIPYAVMRLKLKFRNICTHANLSINFCNDLREVQQQLDPEGTVLLLR